MFLFLNVTKTTKKGFTDRSVHPKSCTSLLRRMLYHGIIARVSPIQKRIELRSAPLHAFRDCINATLSAIRYLILDIGKLVFNT